MLEKKYQSSQTRARITRISLPHGDLETPCFMPVGTLSNIKAMTHQQLEDLRYPIMLSNTYHLYLRPGLSVIQAVGGLHQFNSWKANILTDSGGYQVFSLSKLMKINESGIHFQSHLDGSRHFFSPEFVIAMQKIFNSDIAMVLDVCTPHGISFSEAKQAMDLTHRWAKISLDYYAQHKENWKGYVFPIAQGNFYPQLRKESIDYLAQLDTPGLAIGGLSVGESPSMFYDILEHIGEYLVPYSHKLRYIMGIGTPKYIIEAIKQGIDIFDCVYPTRIARNAHVFTWQGICNLKNAQYEIDFSPVEEKCSCFTCEHYSKAYLRHLFKNKDSLAGTLASIHNLAFIFDLIESIKQAIIDDNFIEWEKEFWSKYCIK